MNHEPTAAEIRAYADKHGIRNDQARRLLSDIDHDEADLSEALQSLRHFLKAPS